MIDSMKTIFLLSILFLLSCTKTEDKFFGDIITKEGISELSLSSLLEDKSETKAKLKGEIVTTCAKKGCWMTVKMNDGQEMRVTFKDYGFFVPKNGVEGQMTVVEGIVKKETTDIETLKHYAQDAGKGEEEIAQITTPKEEFTFVADGVIIQEN
jgi:hypothetical protein